MTFSSLLLTSALLVPAQRPPESPQNTRPAINEPASGAAPSLMAEDIEILRRVLAAKLHSGSNTLLGYTRTGAATNLVGQYLPSSSDSTLWSDPYGGQRSWVSHDGGSVEGVYLPGYGVVLTTTLSGARRDGKPSDDKPVSKPMSDWDRAQAELRGEKPSATPATSAMRSPSVRDIILHVLADNGNHLTRLRDDEKITVVVTFRDGETFFAPQGATFGQSSNPFQAMTPSGLTTTNQQGVAPSSALQPSGGNKQPSSAHDYEMLGDLHLKQSQYQAAAEAYKKAIAAYEEETQGSRTGDYQRTLSSLLARQAQAQIGLGHNDRAVELLQQARSGASGQNSVTAKAPASKPRVPTKLIISATRRQLAALAGGQMNFDEFRRAASIEDE
jgi:tetratricopeptide (TPR) repeat protein